LRGEIHFAALSATLANDLNVEGSQSGLSCSFAGGCLYEVQAKGLASVMKSNPDEAYITVCAEKCVFSESDSSASAVKCKVPEVSTIYSNQ